MAKVNTNKPRPCALELLHVNGSNSSSRSESDDETTVSDPTFNLDNCIYVYITSEELIEILKSKTKDYLLIDLRNSRFYEFHRIKTARNFNCSSSVMCRRSIVKWKKSMSETIFHSIIVYNDGPISKETHELNFKFINAISNNCKEVKILKNGYTDFHSKYEEYTELGENKHKILLYAASPTHKSSSSSDVHKVTLSEIIKDFLYIGNEMDAKDKESLKSYGITDIINVTSSVPNYFEKKFKYYRLPASDSDTQDISQFFPQAYNIICKVRETGGRVLIHCWAGVSRSVTIAMMYIIKSQKIDVLDALEVVKKNRPIADPNLNFLGQLSQIKF